MALEAYCVKCKKKQAITQPEAGFNVNGGPYTKGICGECGTKIFRMGRTDAHENLVQPVKQPRPVKKEGKLVIVESPAKARTVGRFLGKGYKVKASIGHVRDLLKSELSVDVDNNFKPKYRVPNEKRPLVKELKADAKTAEVVFLATDPDREGEAIAWHLLESIEADPQSCHRVVFHEITQSAISAAFNHPRKINMDLVDAQQARRILDRLVGYSISPILWEKVRSRLSAGRVQSVALRLVVEREREIEAFIPVEYWSVDGEFTPDNDRNKFIARLVKINNEELSLSEKTTVDNLLEKLNLAAYQVDRIKKGERKRKPAAPFITSSLQQEASRRLGFTAKRTMALAQQLYEGIEIGSEGAVGLITYMRTDSTNISDDAAKEVREFIVSHYGKEFVPAMPPKHKTRAVGAQEAHEAIRPTNVHLTPENIKQYLNRDQYRLYQLVWQRYVSSQMESAKYDTISVEILGEYQGDSYLFRASGSSVSFPGFLIVYEESIDEDKKEYEANIKIPAELLDGALLKLLRLIPEQHFTQPPPRFSEASLVQTLEEFGIGRPSTYAPILSTIQDRGYVTKEAKKLLPTDTGITVNDLLIGYFSDIINVNFTAHMEKDLDAVALGNTEWKSVIQEFYESFEPKLKKAQDEMPEHKSEPEKVNRPCPECGHDLVIRWGRFGKFISCSNFPKCRYTEPILEKIGVKCPEDGGDIIQRKTRKGRVFYGCSNYPECQFTSWKRPVQERCPNCAGTLVIHNKRELQCLQCGSIFLNETVQSETVDVGTLP